MSRFLFITSFVILSRVTDVYGVVFDSQLENEINAYVTATMNCHRIPGLSLAVVKGDEVWTRGYGDADFTNAVPATNNTLFLIASITKSFTMAVLGALLTEKGMDWSANAVDILGPDYGFVGEFRNKEMTLRDMLSHRTGLAGLGLPLMSGFPSISRAELCRRMKFLPEQKPFRDRFIYNNFMYMVLGHVAEKLGGDTWENLVTDKLYTPLGMTSTTFLTKPEDVLANNVARPYVSIDGRFQDGATNLYSLYPFEPAGAIMTTANDMTKWMKFLMGDGTTDEGDQIINKKLFQEALIAASPLPPSSELTLSKPKFPISDTQTGYGYGLFTSVYRGYKRMWHSGGFNSYVSYVWVFPDKGIGVYASVSGPGFRRQGGDTCKTTLYYISDHLLGETPWLNTTTACTYPEPWRKRTAKSTTEEVYVDMENASEYVGQYGNTYTPDVVVSYDPAHKQQLYIYMSSTSGLLHATRDKDRFLFEVTEPWEMMTSRLNENNVTRKTNAMFGRKDGRVTSLKIKYEVDVTYYKGRSILDHVTVTNNAVSSRWTGDFIVGFCSMIIQLYALL